ncbi:hypothetical protein JG687_00003484 [Phytophthora cactorum]|uniref:COP9 signalosome complex subunit 8 n=1 Tax=Phytophthora cactorum TaxID=29920 RepID=A0A8T1URF4_9STRA|nr:hypothetical protein JG687_00003484 [Phytophthora cactorum]
MDNLVETLQTQREELLTAHAAASDRDTARQIVQQLKSVSEELELVAAAASSSPQSALSPDLYASYLLVVLLSKNLNDARFLWKRIPIEIKQISEELRNAWEVGKALWQRNLAAAYAAMDYDWSPSLQGLVEALKTSTREDAAELLSLAYSTVSVSDAALALGFARHEDAVQYCSSLGWEVSAPNRLILPKPLANTRRGRSTVVDLDQLDTLSKTVLHLEQNTKLLHVRMQKDAAHESLKREYESRAGLEQLLRSYKDEIVTLKEALQIAAQAVAAATMNESPPFEYSEAGDAENSFGSYPAVDEYSKEYYRHEVAAVHPTELHLEQWQEDHQEARSENAFEDAVDE